MAELRYWPEHEAKALIASYGIESPRERLVTSAGEAVDVASGIGFPVVLKVVSAGVPHKTDAGGVRLGIADVAGVRSAYAAIHASVLAKHPGVGIDGILVSEQVRIEHELICGAVRDPQFGPVVAFGLGGIFTEVLHDIAHGIAPLDTIDARAMIRSLRGYAVLAGARGRHPVDEEALAAVLIAAGRLVIERSEIEELDINPLAVTPEGRILALDCLIRTREG